MILRASKYYSNGEWHKNKDIIIENSKITQIRASQGVGVDLAGLLVMPGFIDIHVHGGAGSDVMDATYEALNTISLHKIKEGCTSFCPTTVTAGMGKTRAAIESINEAVDRGVGGARVMGAFLEGPYISPKFKGAHPEGHIRNVSLGEILELLELGHGNIISFAIAPEMPGGIEAIKSLSGRGITVRLGHSAATYEETLAGIEAGGKIAIHTFNAMSPFTHRAPGMIGAALENGAIIAELVCDFIHTHPASANLLRKVKGPGKLVLVTDCMRAGGMPDGRYALGELPIDVHSGVARTLGGALAGSTLTMLKAFQNMHRVLGAPLAEAIDMATSAPAKAIGCFDKAGSIELGKYADIIALDEGLGLKFVMVGGRVVFQ